MLTHSSNKCSPKTSTVYVQDPFPIWNLLCISIQVDFLLPNTDSSSRECWKWRANTQANTHRLSIHFFFFSQSRDKTTNKVLNVHFNNSLFVVDAQWKFNIHLMTTSHCSKVWDFERIPLVPLPKDRKRERVQVLISKPCSISCWQGSPLCLVSIWGDPWKVAPPFCHCI